MSGTRRMYFYFLSVAPEVSPDPPSNLPRFVCREYFFPGHFNHVLMANFSEQRTVIRDS